MGTIDQWISSWAKIGGLTVMSLTHEIGLLVDLPWVLYVSSHQWYVRLWDSGREPVAAE